MKHIRGTFLLAAVYIALTANLELSNIVAGLLLAAGVMALLRPDSREDAWRLFTPPGLVAFVRYTINLVHDLIVSGVQVALLVVNPRLPIHQGVIAIPTSCETVASQALSAHAITVTPGEMVVEMDEQGTMYTHVLDTRQAEEGILDAQQMREQLLDKIAI